MSSNHYLALRRALEKRLPDGLILIEGGKPIVRNFDVEYPFRQKSDFLYLTGFEEPGAWLLIDPKSGKHTLFVPKADEHHRVWIGELPSLEESRQRYGFSEARYHTDLEKVLKRAQIGHRKIYAETVARRELKKILKLPVFSAELRDALDELRAVKTEGELDLLKRANRVSGQSHIQVMRRAKPGQYEYQIQSIFESECLNSGLNLLGYPTIVAAGKNAAVLHYNKNSAKIKAGELVLIDAGAECRGYSADITRVFPINGKFTAQQRDIYSIVLETQKRSIERSLPGVISAELHLGSMCLIAEGLKSIGILKGEVDGLVESGAVTVFYPHGLTHMLGLDVHDVTGGKKRRMPNPTKVPVRFVAKLEPGFVITMEPGIYFIKFLLESPKIREKYRGQIDFKKADRFLNFGGVRIEDDIVIQPHGPPLNLTRVPKEIDAIERLMTADK
jgi:Xaa-Pro dipeptidase